jgi:hypothetical protein
MSIMSASGALPTPMGPAGTFEMPDVSSLIAEEREKLHKEKEDQMRLMREQLAENERLLKEQSVGGCVFSLIRVCAT